MKNIVNTYKNFKIDCLTTLCTIIKESGFESKDAVKDFIYSLEDYDMGREKSLFNVDESSGSVKSENDNDATKSLLKDFSFKIDSLKAENSLLQVTAITALRF